MQLLSATNKAGPLAALFDGGLSMHIATLSSTKATGNSIPNDVGSSFFRNFVGCYEITGVTPRETVTLPVTSYATVRFSCTHHSYLHLLTRCGPSANLYHLEPKEYNLWMWSKGSVNCGRGHCVCWGASSSSQDRIPFFLKKKKTKIGIFNNI